MNRSKGAMRARWTDGRGRKGMKIEKEENHCEIILWQCVKKEGRSDSNERMRIGLGHSLSFHAAAAAAAAAAATFPSRPPQEDSTEPATADQSEWDRDALPYHLPTSPGYVF